MKGIKHPFTGALHERDGHGNVLVTQGDKQGLFRPDGSWVAGELRECDPQLCGWVAGPQVANHRVAEAHD
ncbi:MAG: transposase [Acidimicrobiales bacterium]|nr:transposase [Acidimicrobiales bacterium]